MLEPEMEMIPLTVDEGDTLYKIIIVALEKGGWLYRDVVNMVHVFDKLSAVRNQS
jgi:hypothetical protein